MTNPLTEPATYIQDKSTSEPWLRTLDEIDGTDLPLVGGKAFRLAMLKQHGLSVPPGLVLTTAFFEAQLRHARLIPLWAGSPDVAVTPESLGWLADALKTKPLNQELAQTLDQHLAALLDVSMDRFAVRSSAIDEDQRDHTFAGIHLTELGVPRSALSIAITRCWASALSKPAIEYRQAHGMSIQSIRIAVLIQPMLNPKSAGVGFTVNPLTNSRDELIVEATWGLGEALVSSKVQPHFYKLANQPGYYPLMEQRPGNLPPPDDESAPIGPLSEKELTELATQLEHIHALMGEAQDVEWAKQDDTFFILQTRPVIPPPTPRQTLDWTWTRGSHPEFLPELPSPLFGSLLERSQIRAITLLKHTGLAVDELGPYVKLILGRPYLNLTFLKRIIAQVGIAPGNLLFTIGHTEPGGAGGPLSIDWETAWQARRTYWLILKRMLSVSRFLKRYQALVDKTNTTLDETNLDAPSTTLLNQFRQHDRIYRQLFNTNLRLATAISATTAIGSSLIAPLTPSPATFISTLALMGVKTRDGELNQALLKLGRLARQDEQTLQYLANAPDDFNDYPDNPLISAEFKAGFDTLLATYGQRAIYEADMGWPRYQEDPAPLLRIIRQYAQSEHLIGNDTPGPKPASGRSAVSWPQLTGQAQGLSRLLPWRRWLATPFIRLLRRLLAMREVLNSARAKAMGACRRWDLALGQKWVDQGWLARPDDIFWLTMEEVERTLLVGDDIGITLSSIVQARKETYQTYAETTMPYSLRESQIASIQPGVGLSPEPPADVMIGLPISPGQARGTVVVLNSPDGFEKSAATDTILVMPSTDPAWLPLLRLGTGLIVEMGGLLSHGSVIAREYGLPAVANIPDATKRFQTGDSVLVDGSTGVVQLLEPAQSTPPQNKKAG
jgi:phosphoenolpyruvate synthase/pyruvate phosphate dikinase